MKEIKNNTIDVEKLCKSVDKGQFRIDLPWQRQKDLLDHFHQSLIIDTILRGYKIPAIWLTKTPTETFDENSVIDGVQRTTTIHNFVKGKFKLHRDIKPIQVIKEDTDGNKHEEEYILAGKKFDQLSEYLQSKINDYSLSVIEMFGFSDDEIEEQFLRLNSGASCTKSQKIKVILGTHLAEQINDIERMPFWKRTAISPGQRKDGKITACIMQCLMLLNGYEYASFGANEIEKFCVHYSENYEEDELLYLEEIIDTLDRCMLDKDENNKFLKIINIPMLIMCTKNCMNVTTFNEDWYTEFLDKWVEKYAEYSGYMDCCGAGSTSKAKINGRLEIMEKCLDTFMERKENGLPIEDNDMIKAK